MSSFEKNFQKALAATKATPRPDEKKWTDILEANPVLRQPGFAAGVKRWNKLKEIADGMGLSTEDEMKFIAEGMKSPAAPSGRSELDSGESYCPSVGTRVYIMGAPVIGVKKWGVVASAPRTPNRDGIAEVLVRWDGGRIHESWMPCRSLGVSEKKDGSLTRSELVAEATHQMAAYPQYRDHWRDYVTGVMKKDVRTKLGQAFRKGETVLVNPTPGPHQTPGFLTAWSMSNKVDTSIRADSVMIHGEKK